MNKNYVFEPLRAGIHEIQSSTEAATMILRIDDVIASKSGGKTPPMLPGGGGMGDMGGMEDY